MRRCGIVGGALLIGAVALCAPGAVQAEARVTEVAFTARSDGQGYVVRVHLSESIAAYGIPRRVGEHEVEWILYGARLSGSYQATSPEGPVESYSTTRRNGHLVFHFQIDPNRPITTDAYRDRASSDLLLNLEYDGSPPVADASAEETSSSPPVRNASLSEPSTSDASPPSSSSSQTSNDPAASSSEKPSNVETGGKASSETDVSAEEESTDSAGQTASTSGKTAPSASSKPTSSRPGASQKARERWRLDTVVIDPGHGGKDPGATANGHYEKTIVLSVAKKLGGYLEDKLGLNVVYTRKKDRFIALKERGRMANRTGAKLFLSLHVNAARSRRAEGTETYFLGRHKTEAARKVMERENSVIRYEENTEKYESYDPQKLVVQELAQSMFMQKSEELAGLIQNQFANRVHRKNRGVHQAGFYVLWSASMPSVLVELGFLTNPAEARFLTSEKGQVYLASAIFRAVRAYKTQYEKGIETAARD